MLPVLSYGLVEGLVRAVDVHRSFSNEPHARQIPVAYLLGAGVSCVTFGSIEEDPPKL